MIKVESVIPIVDNSGALIAKCIKVLCSKTQLGRVGSIIIVSIQKIASDSKIEKGQIFKALVVKTKGITYRRSGMSSFSVQNGIILLKKTELVPYSNRIRGVSFIELRKQGFSKLLSLCDFIF